MTPFPAISRPPPAACIRSAAKGPSKRTSPTIVHTAGPSSRSTMEPRLHNRSPQTTSSIWELIVPDDRRQIVREPVSAEIMQTATGYRELLHVQHAADRIEPGLLFTRGEPRDTADPDIGCTVHPNTVSITQCSSSSRRTPVIDPSSSTPSRMRPPWKLASATTSFANCSGRRSSRLNSTPEFSPFAISASSSDLVIFGRTH